MEKEKRLLPGDYQRKIKYNELDDVEKNIEQRAFRFFEFPEDLKGFQFEDREFLVFYFDNKEDYETVKKYFEIPSRGNVSHPKLNTRKLVNLVKRRRGIK